METLARERRCHFKDLRRSKAAQVKRATRRDKSAFYHDKADQARDVARRGDQRVLVELAKDLGRIQKRYKRVMEDTNGNKITSEHEKASRWKGHFQAVLNFEEPLILKD